MPVGPFETFDACVMHMKGQGHDDDAARRVCGKLQSESHKAQKDGMKMKESGLYSDEIPDY